jgi:hypothetical protein
MEVLNRARAMPRSAASVSELTGAAVLLRGPDMVVYLGALDSEATLSGTKIRPPRQHLSWAKLVPLRVRTLVVCHSARAHTVP